MNTEARVKMISTSRVVSVLPDDTLMKVEEIFHSFPFHHVLVMHNRKVLGIISRQDILKEYQRCSHLGVLPDRIRCTAAEIMTPDPISVHPEYSIGLAADIFLSNKIHALPVMDGGEVIGIVTSHDVIKYAFK